jgi:GNAT superfamily N-acetyltransferase
MEDIEIRKAHEQDVAALLALYKDARIETGRPPSAKDAREHLAVMHQTPHLGIFVAHIGSTIVGTYALMIMDSLAKGGLRAGIVEDIAVSPAHQGRGIGHLLMEHAMGECRRAGCYKMVASSGRKGTPAHDFYKSVGFEEHGLSYTVPIA